MSADNAGESGQTMSGADASPTPTNRTTSVAWSSASASDSTAKPGTPDRPLATMLRGVGWVFAVACVFFVALAGGFFSRSVVHVVGVAVPVGWVVAIGVPIATISGVRRLLGTRGGVIASLVWVVAVFTLLLPRGEGDIVVASDWLGYGFLVLVLIGCCWTLSRSLLVRPPESRPVPVGGSKAAKGSTATGSLDPHGRGRSDGR